MPEMEVYPEGKKLVELDPVPVYPEGSVARNDVSVLLRTPGPRFFCDQEKSGGPRRGHTVTAHREPIRDGYNPRTPLEPVLVDEMTWRIPVVTFMAIWCSDVKSTCRKPTD